MATETLGTFEEDQRVDDLAPLGSDVPLTAFLSSPEEESTETSIREVPRPAPTSLPDTLSLEEFEQLPNSDSQAAFVAESVEATEELMAEMASAKMDANELPYLEEYKAWRKVQSERDIAEKTKGFFSQAWAMASQVTSDAALATAAISDALHLPTQFLPETAKAIQMVRKDPDKRTTPSQALVSTGNAMLMWPAQLGLTARNTMDSVSGALYEEIANIDAPAKPVPDSILQRLSSGIMPDPNAFPLNLVRGAARMFLPERLEMDEATEIESEHARLGRMYARNLELPQEGETLIGATRTAVGSALGESSETAVEAGARMSAQVVEPLSRTLEIAGDALLPVGAAKLAMRFRALKPSTVSRAVASSAGAAAGTTVAAPWTLRAAQRIDGWARNTATPGIEKNIRGLGRSPQTIISGTAGVLLSAIGGGAPTVGAFFLGAAAPYAAKAALYMGFGALKWTGRASRGAAIPFARALKAKHEFGLAGPQNSGMWARVASDTTAPAWARSTGAVANRMLGNPRMRQILSDAKSTAVGATVGGITEGLQEMLEEALQTGATAESMGAGFGAGLAVGGGIGGIAGATGGPRDVDNLMLDLDALHFRQRMVERGDDTSYYDGLPQETRRDIAASQAAAIDSTEVRLVNGTQLAAAIGIPNARRLARGVYSVSTGDVLINTEVVTKDEIARVVAHEIGHASFARLPQELKDQWHVIADRTYGKDTIEKYREALEKDRAGLRSVAMDEAYDELYAEHFLGVNSSGKKLLAKKRQISADFGVGRTMRRINNSVLAMMGIEGGVETSTDNQGRMLFDSTPYKADPAVERFIHRALRDLGGRRKLPSLPPASPDTTLSEQEAGVVGEAAQATTGPGSVIEIGNGKQLVLLGQRPDGTFDTMDLDEFEQAIRDLPPDDSRSHRARVAAALEQATSGTRDRDPEVAALVGALTTRTPTRPIPAPEVVESMLEAEVEPALSESAPPLTPEEAADPTGTQITDDEMSSLFESLDDQVESGTETPEQTELRRRAREERQHKKEILEKPEISSIVENAEPSQLKGAKPPGDTRYAPHHRTVDPSTVRAIAGRALSETKGTDDSPETRAHAELNAIKRAAPILSARNARKARLAIESGDGGAEHKVLLEPGNDWVTKVWDTHSNRGLDTPFDYLKRIGLQNELFGDSIQVLGIYGTGIVTRQPFYDAANSPIGPLDLEIREYMADRGFRVDAEDPVLGLTEYSNGRITVADARPDNFIRKEDGELQLIDALIMEEERPARLEPDNFDDVVDDVDETEVFEEEPFDTGDRFAPLPQEVNFEFTRDEESGSDQTILTSNGVPVEGRSSSDFVVYDGQAYISTGLDSGARGIAGRRFKTDPNQLEVHRVNSIVIPDELKGRGLGQALYLSHFQNVDAADAKPTYFYNSQQSAEALAATLALERRGLINFMPLGEGKPTPGRAGGPYLLWLTSEGRSVDPRTLEKRAGVVSALASGRVPSTLGDARPDRFAPAQEPGRTPGVLPSDRAETGGLRGRGRVAGSEAGVSEPYRPYPTSDERPLDNLASIVKVDGRRVEFGPLPVAREAARSYMRQAGLPYSPPTDYVKVDRERATRIADEFERMPHAPEDPQVKAAYRAMIDETLGQYDAIKGTGLVVEPIPFGAPDPYGNPRNAILDVVENNHMWFFPTHAGFGGPASTGVDVSGNPLLEPTGEVINGHSMVANDVFRVVHDYFGHIKEGVGFRADGEENAWRSHSAMYSDLARRAMTTETRGQNSWVNFGPFGEQNQTAGPGDTEYAPQKIGLLPDWAIEEGRGEPDDVPRGTLEPSSELGGTLEPSSELGASLDQSPLGSNLPIGTGDRFAVTQFSSPEGNLPTTVPSKTASRGNPNISDTIIFEDVFHPASSGINKGLSIATHAARTFRNRWRDGRRAWRQGMPGVRPEALRGSDRKVVEAVADEIGENLLILYDHPLVAPWRDRAKNWYVGANRLANDFSRKFGVSIHQAAATVAALSPQKDWNVNVSLADRIGEFLTNIDKTQPLPDQEIDTTISKVQSYASDRMSDAAKVRNIRILESLRGVAFDQIAEQSRPDNWAREAWFIRAWDENNNSRKHSIISPEGNRVRESTGDVSWGSAAEIANAISAMRSDDPSSISTALGAGHKVRNFYNNILTPESPLYGTIDTHQVAADFLSPFGGASLPVKDSFSGRPGIPAKTVGEVGLTGTYPIHFEGLRRAAEARGVLPREMQSITWEAIRGTFSPAFRRSPASSRVLDIWDAVKVRDLSKEDATSRVIDLAGGINPPAWHTGL